MATKIDPRKLRPSDLLRLVNATDVATSGGGSVLTEFQLRRHRNQAGYTIGDARTVDLFRYAAWLTLEYFKPKTEPLTYEEQKARQAERNAEAESASRGVERAAFNDMYRWVKREARRQQIEVILAHKLDRICRNMRDAVRMQELEDATGVRMVFVENEFGPGAAGAFSSPTPRANAPTPRGNVGRC